MAIYRCEVRRISRAGGHGAPGQAERRRSVVACAAYRTASRLQDDANEVQHDYRRRTSGVVHTEILTPEGAPEWAQQRARLWNAVEASEKRKDSLLAREAVLSLPHELDDAQRLALVRQFSHHLVKTYGVAVDFAIHRPDPKGDQRNHHAHVLFSSRRLEAAGFTAKTRELDDRSQGPVQIQAIREHWEQELNQALAAAQRRERVSSKSNAEQGLDRAPQPKLGEAFTALQRREVRPRVAEGWSEVARRRTLTKDRPRHRFERQRLARDYARQTAAPVAKSERPHSPEVQRVKDEMLARAIKAAGLVGQVVSPPPAPGPTTNDNKPTAQPSLAPLPEREAWRVHDRQAAQDAAALAAKQEREAAALAARFAPPPGQRQGSGLGRIFKRLVGTSSAEREAERQRLQQAAEAFKALQERHQKEQAALDAYQQQERARVAREMARAATRSAAPSPAKDVAKGQQRGMVQKQSRSVWIERNRRRKKGGSDEQPP